MSEDTIHIAFCTDTNYVMPTGVDMISVCENNKDIHIVFHLVITLDKGVKEKAQKEITPLVDIAKKYNQDVLVYYLNSEDLEGFECKGEHAQYLSTTAFARILLPNLLSDEIKKVLYIDCDTVVCGSLLPLWNTELSLDCPFGAVLDAHGNSGLRRVEIKTPLTTPYCNSGVLLMNLDCWRREGLAAKTMECAQKKQFALLDQDVINYLYGDRMQILSVRYNMQISFAMDSELHWHVDRQYLDDVRESIKEPVIVHFVHSMKPWKDVPAPYADVWRKYKNMSIWKDMPLQHAIAPYIHSKFHDDMNTMYYADADLVNEAYVSYYRFIMAAVRLKNKHAFVKIISSINNIFAALLEKIYTYKTR